MKCVFKLYTACLEVGLHCWIFLVALRTHVFVCVYRSSIIDGWKCILCFSFFFCSDLIQCTNEMNVNIPQLADTLFERTASTSWVVVFKSLTATHNLMVYGNEVGLVHGY